MEHGAGGMEESLLLCQHVHCVQIQPVLYNMSSDEEHICIDDRKESGYYNLTCTFVLL